MTPTRQTSPQAHNKRRNNEMELRRDEWIELLTEHASPAIAFQDVTISYGRERLRAANRKKVLDSLDFAVYPGDMICLLGPSGCGKTTMVKLVMGLMVPDTGEVRVLGELAPFPHARCKIGYMPQDEALYDNITAEENLRFFGEMEGIRGRELDRQVDELLGFMQLEHERKSLVRNFSGGMKRRLSFALALVSQSELLVLDEPTVGLDPAHRRRIWNGLREMRDQLGTTLLITTHVMDEAARCDSVAMLNEGRIVAQGSPAQILAEAGVSSLEEAFMAFQEHRVTPAGCVGNITNPRSLNGTLSITKRILAQLIHDPRTLLLLFGAPLLVIWLLSIILSADAQGPRIAVVGVPPELHAALEEQDARVVDADADVASDLLGDAEVSAVLSMKDGAVLDITVEGSDSGRTAAVMRVASQAIESLQREAIDEARALIERKGGEASEAGECAASTRGRSRRSSPTSNRCNSREPALLAIGRRRGSFSARSRRRGHHRSVAGTVRSCILSSWR